MSEPFDIIPRQEVGQEAWDAFVAASDEAWLWHCYHLQDALASWPGRRDASVAVVEGQGREVVAVLPLHRIEKRLIGRLWPLVRLDSLGGPACRNDLADKTRLKLLDFCRHILLEQAKTWRAGDVTLSLPPLAPALRGERCPRVNPLLGMGCCNTLSQTWVVDLRRPVEELWRRMHGRARTAVRKARKKGVTVRSATPAEQDLEIYYRLHQETYQRTDARPHPRAYFALIWDKFLATGQACVWFAELNGEVVAAANFALFKGASWYWTGAASQKGLAVEANSLLQWTAMRVFADQGVEWHESGEAFPGAPSGSKKKRLSEFKRSFGGELYPFYKARLPVSWLGWLWGCWQEKRSLQ